MSDYFLYHNYEAKQITANKKSRAFTRDSVFNLL